MLKYFTISELTKSSVADAHHINNQPSPEVVDNLERLITYCLDPIREAWGKPIYVNSGYRCEELNNKVKGAKNSQHLLGKAADITTKSVENNKKLFELIQSSGVDFDQLIDENNYGWIHVSYNNRKQVLHLK